MAAIVPFVSQALVGIAVSTAFSLASAALLKKKKSATTAVSGTSTGISTDPTRPMSISVGLAPVDGSLVYSKTHGTNLVYREQVIALADYPCDSLLEFWVAKKKVTIEATADGDLGHPITEYRNKAGAARLWIRFYPGSFSPTADPRLVVVSGGEWTSSFKGVGTCYACLTGYYDADVFAAGWPEFRFVLKGAKVYDRRKDSTNGGSGAHRYADTSTHEWSDNPFVIADHLARGFAVCGEPLYGLNLTDDALPASTWFAAMNACDELVALKAGGSEKRYRVGGEILVSSEPRDALNSLALGAAGKFVDVAGQLKPYAGVAQAGVFSFTDAAIVLDAEYEHTPNRKLHELTNTTTGSYIEPGECWGKKDLPVRTSEVDRAADGGRQLAESFDLTMIYSATQGQRILEIKRREARLQVQDKITLDPTANVLEPEDVVTWTSTQWGYLPKTFRVDALEYAANTLVPVTLLEYSSAIYSWNGAVDELDAGYSELPSAAPDSAEVAGLEAAATTIPGAGAQVIPALALIWTPPNDSTWTAITFEIRTGDTALPPANSFDPQSGQLIITAGILPSTEYEVRALPVLNPPRDRVWTAWVSTETGADFVVEVDTEINEESIEARHLTVPLRTALLADMAVDRAELWTAIRSLGNTLASTASAVQRVRRDLRADTGAALATFAETIETLADEVSASVNQVVKIEAETGSGVAAGEISFVAISAPSGVAAAWRLELSATAGGTKRTAGLELHLVDDGSGGFIGRYIVTADQFAVQTPDGNVFPLLLDADSGNLWLNGVKLQADSIVGRKILSVSGKSYWDLDNDQFVMSDDT